MDAGLPVGEHAACAAELLPALREARDGTNYAPCTEARGQRTAQLTRGTDTLWNVTVLDDTASVTLPTLTPDPLGAGAVDLAISTAEAASFDAKKFDVPTTKKSLVRAAGAKGTFTR